MARESVCVRPSMLPANMIVAPNSPSARAQAMTAPASNEGRASGTAVEDARSASDTMVFHAGTALQEGDLVTAGGRVLCATALGETLALAQQRAYELLAGIRFEGAQYRHDIGYRGVKE